MLFEVRARAPGQKDHLVDLIADNSTVRYQTWWFYISLIHLLLHDIIVIKHSGVIFFFLSSTVRSGRRRRGQSQLPFRQRKLLVCPPPTRAAHAAYCCRVSTARARLEPSSAELHNHVKVSVDTCGPQNSLTPSRSVGVRKKGRRTWPDYIHKSEKR